MSHIKLGYPASTFLTINQKPNPIGITCHLFRLVLPSLSVPVEPGTTNTGSGSASAATSLSDPFRSWPLGSEHLYLFDLSLSPLATRQPPSQSHSELGSPAMRMGEPPPSAIGTRAEDKRDGPASEAAGVVGGPRKWQWQQQQQPAEERAPPFPPIPHLRHFDKELLDHHNVHLCSIF